MKFFSLFIICFILISCNSEQSQKDSEYASAEIDQEESLESHEKQKTSFHLNFPEIIKNQKEIWLSDIVKSIRYVSLETSPDYMIGEKAVLVKPCGDLIFIGEHGKPIGVFNFDGKFLYTIGNIGKGPGEYNFDYQFWPDGTTQKIHISNTNIRGITSYSFKGDYIGDINPESRTLAFAPLGKDRFLSWTWRQEKYNDSLFTVYFHDDHGKIYKRIFEEEKNYDNLKIASILSPHFAYSPDGVLFNSWESNTIHRARMDGDFSLLLSWELGKYEMPDGIKTDYSRYQKEKRNYIRDINAWESKENIFIKYHYKRDPELAVLSKLTGEAFIVANQDTLNKGVYNDIDGGPSFWPYWHNDNGSRFFKLIQAIDLLDASELNPNREIKNHQAARDLTDIIAKLDEYSNPVLMIVELK